MAKIKLTKGELKRQRDSLDQFRHYLPTLQLKKKQLQINILDSRRLLATKEVELQEREESISQWVGLLADPELRNTIDLRKFIIPDNKELRIEITNIAGANVPFFKALEFSGDDYDLYSTPFWVDQAISELREYMTLLIEVLITRERISILKRELRITTQRVNLFEKIKIPECLENIRKIRIYLGDQQSNAVGISKVAKKKIELRENVGAGLQTVS